MKAVEIKKTGGPEVLELKDITLDKPGPDQVTIGFILFYFLQSFYSVLKKWF